MELDYFSLLIQEKSFSRGAYGHVYRATYNNSLKVVLKLNLIFEVFLKELGILKELKHKNIINLIGNCFYKKVIFPFLGTTRSVEGSYIVLEDALFDASSLIYDGLESHLSIFTILKDISRGLKQKVLLIHITC